MQTGRFYLRLSKYQFNVKKLTKIVQNMYITVVMPYPLKTTIEIYTMEYDM